MHSFPLCSCPDCNEYANGEDYQAAFAQINQGNVLEAVDKALIRHGMEMMKAVWEEDAEAFCKPIWAQIEEQVSSYTREAQEAQKEQEYYDAVYE